MDIRKKEIRNLEAKKRQDLVSIDRLLESLGESRLSRIGEDVPEYLLLTNEIHVAETEIVTAEADITRLKQLDEDIHHKEKEQTAQARELSLVHARLGEAVLRSVDYEDFAQPYQEQVNALLPKIQSLEDRLGALEDRSEGGNVFTWIGKNAQAMVLRTFLGKNQQNLQRIYSTAGEKFAQSVPEESVSSGEIGELLHDLAGNRVNMEELRRELRELREQKRDLTDSYSADGGPNRKIHALKRQIHLATERLQVLYRTYGQKTEDEHREGAEIIPALEEDEPVILEKIEALRTSIKDNERRIERLSAALAIDEERGKIDKMEKSIRENRERIALSEALIEELTQKIVEAKAHIQELSQLL